MNFPAASLATQDDADYTPGPGEYRLLPADLTMPTRPRRFIRLAASALRPARGPQFRLQRSGHIVFRSRLRRMGALFFPF